MRFFRQLFNNKGEEIPDSTRSSVLVKLKKPLSLHDKVLEVIKSAAWQQRMRDSGRETLEEANDFDTGEDGDFPRSIHEEDENGEFIGALEDGIRNRMVEDVQMSERHRELVSKAKAFVSNGGKPKSDGGTPKNEKEPLK